MTSVPYQILQGDQINEDEMDEVWSAGERKKMRMVLEAGLKDRAHFEDQSLGGKLN